MKGTSVWGVIACACLLTSVFLKADEIILEKRWHEDTRCSRHCVLNAKECDTLGLNCKNGTSASRKPLICVICQKVTGTFLKTMNWSPSNEPLGPSEVKGFDSSYSNYLEPGVPDIPKRPKATAKPNYGAMYGKTLDERNKSTGMADVKKLQRFLLDQFAHKNSPSNQTVQQEKKKVLEKTAQEKGFRPPVLEYNSDSRVDTEILNPDKVRTLFKTTPPGDSIASNTPAKIETTTQTDPKEPPKTSAKPVVTAIPAKRDEQKNPENPKKPKKPKKPKDPDASYYINEDLDNQPTDTKDIEEYVFKQYYTG